MPTLGRNSSSNNLIPATFTFVDVRQSWLQDWQYVPYLEALKCTEAAAPTIGTAELLWSFGQIKREDSNSFGFYSPVNLTDWFVRIRTMTSGRMETVFVGVITNIETIYNRQSVSSGDQVIVARELGYILDRIKVDRSYTDEGDLIDWVPTFNQAGKNPDELLGNRTSQSDLEGGSSLGFAKLSFDPADQRKHTWGNHDIVSYLLDKFAPSGISYVLRDIIVDPSAAYQNDRFYLNTIKTVVDLEGASIWQALNQLIDRRRGVGFRTAVTNDNKIAFVVYSLSDYPIQISGTNLPANNNKVFFNMPTSFPQSHMVGDVPFNVDSANLYDEIRVRGDRISITGTYSFVDGLLEKAWSAQDETDYLAAASSDDESVNDLFRSQAKFENVFKAFRLISDWDGDAGDGDSGVWHNVMPLTYSNGDVKFEGFPHWYKGEKRFQRDTPLLWAVDYSETPIVAPTSEPEFTRLIVMIKDTVEGDLHRKDDDWHFVDRVHYDNEDLVSSDVSLLDKGMGFVLKTPPLYYANGHYDKSVDASTNHLPELDYEQLLCTATFISDQRQHLLIKRLINPVKKLTITIPASQYWYVSKNTVIDIDENGELKRIDPANLVLRNDIDLLKSVLAAALGWYGVKRQAVSVPIMQTGRFVEIGSFLTNINSFQRSDSVRTPISSRTIDFRNGVTVIQTAYNEIDFGSLVGT